MRLRRLDLIRYGKFTGHSIDLGAASLGEPDLHIVYGPNEAGKSTALSGYLDLLYGIGKESPFKFLHPYSTMRIGAVLELANGPQELIRIKRPQNSLLDAHEQPIPESTILAELNGIDRDSYCSMFSLDDKTLEEGGESILASQGELGRLLFSASAGLAELAALLEELRTEAEEFYKPRSRDSDLELVKKKKQLIELKDKRANLDTLAPHYAQLVESHDRAKSLYDAAIAERGRIQARMEEIQRLLYALPRLTDLRRLREDLKPLNELPEPPPRWAEAYSALKEDETALASRAESLASEIERLTTAIEAIVVDDKVLAQAEKLAALDDLRARHLTANKDLPERRLSLRDSELVIAGILARIDRRNEADPAQLILPATVLGSLRGLMEARSGIDADLKSAQDETAQALQRLTEAQTKLAKQGEGQESQRDRKAKMAALEACVAELRMSDHTARRRLLERELEDRQVVVQDRLNALQPWQGDPHSLADLLVPNQAIIEHWKNALITAEQDAFRRKADVEHYTTDRLHLEAELAAIDRVAGLVSDEEASKVRRARETAWAAHRLRLDETSADEFEAALRKNDRVTETRYAHMVDVAKRKQASQRLIIVESDLRRVKDLEEEAKTALQKLRDEIAAALRAIGADLTEPLSLAKVESWLSSRAKALEDWSLFCATERYLHRADAEIGEARTKLTLALTAAGVPHENNASYEALLALAQIALDQESELVRLKQAVEERQSDLAERERKAQKAFANKRAWEADWAKVCSTYWLGATGVMPTIPVVREIMEALAGLGPAMESKASLAHRVKTMESDQAKFTEALAAIALDLNIDSTNSTPLELHSIIADLIQQAQSAKTARREKEWELDDARRRMQTHAEKQAIHEKRKTDFVAYFGVDSLSAAGTALQNAVKKVELWEHLNRAATELLNATGLPTLAEAEQALGNADRTVLTAELDELKTRIKNQDQQCLDLYSALQQARDGIEAVGGDDAVARIEEQRKTILLEIEEGALRNVRLRIGIRAAELALRLYRDRHRSSMMKQASDAFRTMSRGAYEGLATQPEKQSEVLIAIRAGGGSKCVTDLSKGTRFQLYLALRVAGYHESARVHPPVPFIADDIMETFDDFRAEEAVRLFADMATVGQVIYFTHHQHIVAITRRICPSARMHELP